MSTLITSSMKSKMDKEQAAREKRLRRQEEVAAILYTKSNDELALLAVEKITDFGSITTLKSEALLVHIVCYQLRNNGKLEIDRGDILIRNNMKWYREKTDQTPESVARAAILALLRANEIELEEN